MIKILLVEDDHNLGTSLRQHLQNEGYEVNWCINYTQAQQQSFHSYDLAIIDWMLPDGQGPDLIKFIRQTLPQLPIIILTAKSEIIDKIIGLESGANDYMTKPFSTLELLARIRTHLRVASNSGNPCLILKYRDITIDVLQRTVQYQKQFLELTKIEFDLLKTFFEQPARVFSREYLLDKVWGMENFPTTRTVDTHILQLRQKINSDLFDTVRGIGYKLRSVKKN